MSRRTVIGAAILGGAAALGALGVRGIPAAHALDPLIQKATVTGSPAQMLSLTGLNLVKGKYYRLVLAIQCAVTTPVVCFYLALNGDYNTGNYVMNAMCRSYKDAPNVITTHSVNSCMIGDSKAEATAGLQVFDLVIAPNGKTYLISHGCGCEEWNFEIGVQGMYYDAPVSSITQIDYIADTPGSLAVGSFLAVYNTE